MAKAGEAGPGGGQVLEPPGRGQVHQHHHHCTVGLLSTDVLQLISHFSDFSLFCNFFKWAEHHPKMFGITFHIHMF